MPRRQLAATGLVIAAGFVTTALAWHEGAHETVRPLAVRDIQEQLNGQATQATAVEVSFAPGQSGAPHRHPGPTFGFVLEGEYQWAIDDQPAKILKAGETFYEPAGCLHRVSGNPGKVKTRVLAWVLHPHDAHDIVIPEPSHE